MLIIRQAQMDALQRGLNSKYAWKVLPQIKEHCAMALPVEMNSAVVGKIVLALEVAQHYGFSQDRHIQAFTEISIILGPEFHRGDEFADILSTEEFGDDMKISKILEKIFSRLSNCKI